MRAAVVGRVDVIFCRNVLIYFGAELRARVLAKLAQGLCRGGFLCLGASERTASKPVCGSPAKARSTPLLHRTVRPSSEVRSDGATIRTAGTGGL